MALSNRILFICMAFKTLADDRTSRFYSRWIPCRICRMSACEQHTRNGNSIVRRLLVLSRRSIAHAFTDSPLSVLLFFRSPFFFLFISYALSYIDVEFMFLSMIHARCAGGWQQELQWCVAAIVVILFALWLLLMLILSITTNNWFDLTNISRKTTHHS